MDINGLLVSIRGCGQGGWQVRAKKRVMAMADEGEVEVLLLCQPSHHNIVMRTRRVRAIIRVRMAHHPCYVALLWLL